MRRKGRWRDAIGGRFSLNMTNFNFVAVVSTGEIRPAIESITPATFTASLEIIDRCFLTDTNGDALNTNKHISIRRTFLPFALVPVGGSDRWFHGRHDSRGFCNAIPTKVVWIALQPILDIFDKNTLVQRNTSDRYTHYNTLSIVAKFWVLTVGKWINRRRVSWT